MAQYKQRNDIDIPDDFELPEGNVLRGQLLFKKHCSQCHTIRKDGQNPFGTLWGPNLYGVLGRTAAQNQRSSWSKYSKSLEDSGILWTERNMMAFLKNPRAFAGGAINMNFRGIDSFRDRVDLVHYLRRAGHESWMVQDGTPHSQKQWWAREEGGKTQSYWQANMEEKQLKPWQHVSRAAARKAGDLKSSAMDLLGMPSAAEPQEAPVDSWAAKARQDPEARSWQRGSAVVDGVKTASVQSAFNWPPPEVIAEGPVRKPPPPARGGAAAFRSLSRPADPQPPRTTGMPLAVASCEEEQVGSGLPPGVRLPCGLLVYKDQGGPAAAPPPAPPPKRRGA